MRIFTPTSAFAVGRNSIPNHVKHWTWTRSAGLRVKYIDGLECRSAWGSLPEFLKAVAEHREIGVIESKGEG